MHCSGASAVAIDNKIEQAMVSFWNNVKTSSYRPECEMY